MNFRKFYWFFLALAVLSDSAVTSVAALSDVLLAPKIPAKKILKFIRQKYITKLENLKIVSQVSKGKRDRLYCATAILAILEEPTKLHVE